MKFLRLIFAAAMLMTCAAFAFAQQPVCTQKRPAEYKGFQLGMTMMDVKDKMADPSTFDSKLSALSKINTQAIQLLGSELKDEYAEYVESVNLTFVDKRLSSIKVTYNGADSWMGAQDFFKQTAEKLGVPAPAASSSSRGRGGERARVDCAGFAVLLAYSFGVSPNVTIYDSEKLKLVDERSEKNPDGEVKQVNIGPAVPIRRNPPR